MSDSVNLDTTVTQMSSCGFCSGVTMRVWNVEIEGKPMQLCIDCVHEAMERGGFTRVDGGEGPVRYVRGQGVIVE